MTNAKIPLLLCIITVFFYCALVDMAYASISTNDEQKMLYISEVHGMGGDSTTWAGSDNLLNRKMSPSYQLGSGGLTQTVFPGASQALETVKSSIIVGLNTYVTGVSGFLKTNNYSSARVDWFFNFQDSGDSNAAKKVYLPLVIYPDGKTRNLGWRIVSSTPRVLYYIYRSKGTEDNLPAGWSYPDGGVLYKYVLDQNYSIISSTSINTGGRYDPPATPEGDSAVNPNAGLELMITEVAKTEMKDKSALFAIADYSRRVSPYYECNGSGDCTAVVSVESLSRSLNVADVCTGLNDQLGGSTYNNTGRVGYTLEYKAERYFIEPEGNYSLTASSTGYTVSPMTQDFNKTITVNNSQNAATLAYTIIDPFSTNALYDFRSDTVNNLPCNRYLYAGWQCVQAPVTVNSPVTSWAFSAPSPDGYYRFYPSNIQDGYPGVVRWRIFSPSGSCIRFDTYKYTQSQVPVSVYGYNSCGDWGCDFKQCSCWYANNSPFYQYACSCPYYNYAWWNGGSWITKTFPYCTTPSSDGFMCFDTNPFNCEYGCTSLSLSISSVMQNVWIKNGIQMMYPRWWDGNGHVYSWDGEQVCIGDRDFNEWRPLVFGYANGVFVPQYQWTYGVLNCKYSCYQVCYAYDPYNARGYKAAYGAYWNYYQNW
ncbi:MAG: hypothetical protein M1510_13155 [Nitrospirae bacterium]|nr:hypothetical protein [Nitrospirota bacterium]